MEKRKNAKEIKDIVGSLLNKIEKGGFQKAGATREAWLKTVDEKTAEHTNPVNFKKGVLTVIVENSSWLYKMTLEKRDIIKKFNEHYTGRQKVIEIKIRVGKTEI